MYRQKIKKTAESLGYTDVETAHVEAYMRLQFGTLDHLGGQDWIDEVRIACECALEASTEESDWLAESYGLLRAHHDDRLAAATRECEVCGVTYYREDERPHLCSDVCERERAEGRG